MGGNCGGLVEGSQPLDPDLLAYELQIIPSLADLCSLFLEYWVG